MTISTLLLLVILLLQAILFDLEAFCRHRGLMLEASCALLDHLGGILAHLSGSPVAKLPGRGIIDPEFFPMLQISQKSTKTKPLFAPRCQKKKRAGGGRPPQGSQ